MGCTTSCFAPSVAELNKSLKAGDERAMLQTLASCPKLLSTCTSLLSTTAITPLHVACEHKHIKVVEQLISFLSCSTLETVREALLPYCRRADMPLPTAVPDGVRLAVDMVNAKGQTPLMYACFVDCPQLVKLLLAHGADPWVGDRCGNRTPLHYAAMGGSTSCIQALMKHIPPRLLARQGVRYVNARSICGLTPLHYGIFFGKLEAIHELLHHDPNINAATTSESYDVFVTCEVASSPLHFAAVRGNEAAARVLLQYYAQRLSSGQPVLDPRGQLNITAQLPWQVAHIYHPANLSLAAMLHPGQNIYRALGGPATGADVAATPSLATIAAAALREKLLGQLRNVKEERAAAASASAEPATVSPSVGCSAGDSRRALSPEVTETCSGTSSTTTTSSCILGRPQSASSVVEEVVAETCPSRRVHICSSGGVDRQQVEEEGGQGHSARLLSGAPASRCYPESCRLAGAKTSQVVFKVNVLAAEGGADAGFCEGAATSSSACSGDCSCSATQSAPGAVARGAGSGQPAVSPSSAGEDELCGLCFVAPQAVAPAGCGHGVCGACATQLCCGMARRPLQCPFCRGVVSGWVSHAPACQ